jgi:integrase/recombinase XerC
MAAQRHLSAVPKPATGSAEPRSPAGVPTAEALASFLRHLASRRGRFGRITSPETVRSYWPRTPEATTKCKALCSCWSRRCSAGARNRLHTLMSLGLRTCDQR